MTGGLSSCGQFFGTDQVPVEQRVEVFEFELEPGTKGAAEVERIVDEIVPEGRIIPGSGVHRASVEAPSGRIDFYAYRMVDLELGPQPVFCTSAVSGTAMAAGCGADPEILQGPVQAESESWGPAWRTADLLVQADVARVEATAEDGTVYAIIPANGVGYVEWPEERGRLELVAFDSQGEELGRGFTEAGP